MRLLRLIKCSSFFVGLLLLAIAGGGFLPGQALQAHRYDYDPEDGAGRGFRDWRRYSVEWYGLNNGDGGFGLKYEFYPSVLVTFNQDRLWPNGNF